LKIVLARHGKLDWDFKTPIPGHGLAAWLRGERDAPLDPSHRPSPELERLARDATRLIATPLRRSLESARILAPSAVPLVDAHFQEPDLPCAIRSGVRLSPDVWSWLARTAWFCGWSAGVEPFKAARARARNAASILAAHAETQGVVVVVGHGLMNLFIARQLRRRGWRGPRLPLQRHWAFDVYERTAA